jgi:hypothetical protein
MTYKMTKQLVETMMISAGLPVDQYPNLNYWTRVLNAHFKGKVLAKGWAVMKGDVLQVVCLTQKPSESEGLRNAKVEIREVL